MLLGHFSDGFDINIIRDVNAEPLRLLRAESKPAYLSVAKLARNSIILLLKLAEAII